ncbi:MAG TPA: hemolysin family protein [Deltaproteobacteria bacterium]|jgi:putative hemolysin|nr:hemolysin family protein [Deltaproteobacteria bacterium]HOI05547.1 hemolysin family protein [Deltaproteobacteria bacterium]
MVVDVAILLLLIVANGIFALTEIAVVSARRARLQQRAESGDKGSATALKLITEPTRFFSTVQVGITLIGILAGAYGGATIAGYLTKLFLGIPLLVPYAYPLSLGLVVLIITYLTLVLGELLPKRIALYRPEGIASAVSRPMELLAFVLAPVVYVLSASTNLLARIMGIKSTKELPVTAEEITILLEQGESAGVFEPTEQDIIENALRLDDVRVSALITPRTDIVWLDTEDPMEATVETVMSSRLAYFPVARESLDNVEGVVRGTDVLVQKIRGLPGGLAALMRPPVFVPESQSALEMLEMFKHSGGHMALVIDEFGGLIGLVTLTDIIETLVGEIRSPGMPEEPDVVMLEEGGWLLDGSLPLHEFMEIIDMRGLPEDAESGFDTLGGFMMAMLGRIPSAGDSFEYASRRFEVTEMDGKRVARVRVVPLAATPSGEEPEKDGG